ncbi:hypothetical protein AB0B51_23175, partial [Streptomyces griseus]
MKSAATRTLRGAPGRALALGGGVTLLALALTGCGGTDVDDANPDAHLTFVDESYGAVASAEET